MSFEESLAKETGRMSREFGFYGGLVGLITGIAATLVLQAVFQ